MYVHEDITSHCFARPTTLYERFLVYILTGEKIAFSVPKINKSLQAIKIKGCRDAIIFRTSNFFKDGKCDCRSLCALGQA